MADAACPVTITASDGDATLPPGGRFTVGVNSVTGGEMICDIVFVILLGIQFLLCLHTKYIHH